LLAETAADLGGWVLEVEVEGRKEKGAASYRALEKHWQCACMLCWVQLMRWAPASG